MILPKRPQAFVFDVDGTVAMHDQRNPYDWRGAGEDRPNGQVGAVLRALHGTGYRILYVSGRPEDARQLTEDWIGREVGVIGPLFMRATSDSRRDTEIKREIFETQIGPYYEVLAVFDDRNQVVRMWREELGLTCFQVADGNF